MNISIRKFEERDIAKKVDWINNPENHKYLHYDLPLSVEKTKLWLDHHKNEDTRYDAIIEADGVPVGIIGLLSIDSKNRKAEYYITMGETAYKRKGVARRASELILQYGFECLQLNRIYLFTEVENTSAQRLFEHLGFRLEGTVREDVAKQERYVDRFMYGMLKNDYQKMRGGGGTDQP